MVKVTLRTRKKNSFLFAVVFMVCGLSFMLTNRSWMFHHELYKIVPGVFLGLPNFNQQQSIASSPQKEGPNLNKERDATYPLVVGADFSDASDELLRELSISPLVNKSFERQSGENETVKSLSANELQKKQHNNGSELLEQFLEENISHLLQLLNPTVPTHLSVQRLKDTALRIQLQEVATSVQNSSTALSELDLSSLLIEEGGKPIRNIIFTTWRSGSTFLGEAIETHPAMFYHYEPLLHFEIVQVRDGELAQEGLRVIRNLLECNYSELKEYVNYGETHKYLHYHNLRLWKYCRQNFQLCMDSDFLSSMCKKFPFQIMKTVRMRLKLAETLLNDPNLDDVRILLLIRDPRGILQSRKHRTWCPENPDCDDPYLLCADIEDDFYAASQLLEKFPHKLRVARYEDISLNPVSGIKLILDFFRLIYHPSIERFIKTHTVVSMGGVSSTFRDSRTTPFRWLEYFSNHTDELEKVQSTCGEAMRLWGYAPFDPAVDTSIFKPLLSPSWPAMTIISDESEIS